MTAWLFTFGSVHEHPETGEPLRNYYVRLEGSERETRRQMFAMFGPKWSHAYPDIFTKEIEDGWGTVELPRERWPEPRYLRRDYCATCLRERCNCYEDECPKCHHQAGQPW